MTELKAKSMNEIIGGVVDYHIPTITGQCHADAIYSAVDALNRAIAKAKQCGVFVNLEVKSFGDFHVMENDYSCQVDADVVRKLPEDKSKRA